MLRNRTLTSRFWKLKSGLYALPPSQEMAVASSEAD